MRMRLYAAAVLSLAVLGAVFNVGSTANAQNLFPWNSASESYFTLHVDQGTVSVRVDAEFLNTTNYSLTEVVFWAMPGAKNAKVVSPDGTEQPIEVTEGSEATSTPSLVIVNQELKPKIRTKYTLTYDMNPQKGEYTDIKPGAIEALFVSQGPGSFVYIDVPKSGDTYLDPGCLLAKNQGGVGSDGLERWICGETFLLALYGEDKSLMDRCAAADNRCRQRQFILPFSAFAQSITDESLMGRLSESIPMAEGNVLLELRHFKSDEEWARKQFDVAKKAMPMLEGLFGFPYPHEHAILKQSRFIGLVGAAGIAFTSTGEMLIEFGGGSDEQTVIHELAHQWAGLNLGEKWIWEGLAEWASQEVGNALAVPVDDLKWQQWGYTDNLANWLNGSLI
ncbi:MAG TPA: hypothetical protein PJ994_12155, partial [Tepidiformaceae bacterium]|nr:hypothetical protein [Tepidiformaceae bacterium]